MNKKIFIILLIFFMFFCLSLIKAQTSPNRRLIEIIDGVSGELPGGSSGQGIRDAFGDFYKLGYMSCVVIEVTPDGSEIIRTGKMNYCYEGNMKECDVTFQCW